MKINSIGKQNFTADLAFFDKSANNKTLKKSGYMLSMAFKRMTEDIPNRKMLVTVNDYSDKDTFELMDSEFNVLTSSEFKFSKLLDNLNYEQATNRLKDIFSVLTNKANNIEDIKSLKRMRKEFQAMLDELEYSKNLNPEERMFLAKHYSSKINDINSKINSLAKISETEFKSQAVNLGLIDEYI